MESKDSMEMKKPRESFFQRLGRKGKDKRKKDKLQEEKSRYQKLTEYILDHTELKPQQISAVTYARDVGLPEAMFTT